MTVKELIKELQSIPEQNQNDAVKVLDDNEDEYDIAFEIVAVTHGYQHYYLLKCE